MKKLSVVLLLVLCVACVFTACNLTETTYTITSEKSSYTVTVGQQIDFKSYFTITSSEGKNIPVTDDMIDATTADVTKVGAFIVTCSYEKASLTIIFVVEKASDGNGGTTTPPSGDDGQGGTVTPPAHACQSICEKCGGCADTTCAETVCATKCSCQQSGGTVTPPSESASIDLTSADNKVSASATKLEFADGNLKVTVDKASATSDLKDYSDQGFGLRVYKGATLTVEYPQMTKIVITCDSYTNGDTTYYSGFDGMTVSGATISRDNLTITITLSNATDKFVSAPVSSQVRILSIEVFTGDNGGTTTPPSGDNGQGGTVTPPTGDDDNQTTVDLAEIFAKYEDYADWNFKLRFDVDAADPTVAQECAYTLLYSYDGYNFYYTDEQGTFVDYVVYTDTDTLYYYDNEDGTYTKLSYNDNYDEFIECYYYIYWVDLAQLADFSFVAKGNYYSASNPSDVGNAIFGEYDNCTYTSFDLYISDGKIIKIVATQQDDDYDTVFTYTAELSNYGTITVDVSNLDVDDDASNTDQGGTVTPPSGDSQQDITVTFANSTGETTLVSTGDVVFTSSRAVDGWDDNRGLQFLKQNGSVTLTSTTSVNNVSSISIDISSNKAVDITVTVKVGSTVFNCNGQNQVVFQNNNNNELTFTTPTAVSGTVYIQVVPATTGTTGLGSIYFKTVTISATGAGSGSSTQKEVMPEQSFDEGSHVDYDDILFDAKNEYDEKEDYFASNGLSSQGTYNALVIPVEFSNDKFTPQELTDIGNVFNNKASTGWESVSSYYQTSSYGKLNITFDIADKVTLSSTYQSFDGGEDYGGDILKLALDALEKRGFDFSNYDYDKDGFIDGVYIIYSAPIDYDEADYYWAYAYVYNEDHANPEDTTKYDGLWPYNYLFASVDFMYEDIETSDPDEFYPIDGLKLNATTYIHETGHMLGLDDYYDYNPNQGSNQGLGGADMMDYTVGDHNAFSKLMLGWVKPTVVTSTQTITISAFESSGQFIIILLDYDGTYFSEYLIIDLYSSTGLNQMHAGVDGSYLYDGANFGARIYHVDATIANPYGDSYCSFTDNNNSVSRDPLIKLVEADGDKNFESDQVQDYYGDWYGLAAEDDLWQTGDVFSAIQPNYARNDGKLVNFDISFDSVTADSLTITVTFAEAE